MNEREDQLVELLALDVEDGPARRIAPADADAILAGVLDGIHARRSGRPRLWVAAAAGIAVAVFSGGAIAAWYASRVVAARNRVSTPPPREAQAPRDPAPAVIDAPVPEVVEVPRDRDRDRRKVDAPEDLLARANELRGKEKWAAAERTYSRVVRGHPRSQAAYVAAIAAASLRLEHLGDPRGALEMFERARATQPNGALDADVLFGMAAAHRALGDRSRERSTLERLLSRHPRSVFAPAAKKRLAEDR